MNLVVRSETLQDVSAIFDVTKEAFLSAPHTDHTEQFIVDALRAANALTVSLVAEIDGKIVGHVAISLVEISDDSVGWYGLGPVSVLPEYQRKGIGSQLIKKALEEIKVKGAAGCVVLGDPNYYGRFGFEMVDGLTFPDVPPEYFQALSFSEVYAHGDVTYHEAFFVQE